MLAQLKLKLRHILGEGPIWNAFEKKVYWTDILNGVICRSNEQGDEMEIRNFPFHIGSFAFTNNNKMLLATNIGLLRYSFKDHHYEKINDDFELQEMMRCNDGKVDLNGEFWFGTMQYEPKEHAGAIYRLTKDLKIVMEKDRFKIANGLAWGDDKMYIVDSGDRNVYEIPLVAGNPDFSKAKLVYHSLEEDVTPDGMTIDSEGNLWIALWGGGKVIHLNPTTQTVINEIQVPVPLVTSCTFVGEDLMTLWITTATSDLSEEQLKEYPLSGSIFAANVLVKGTQNRVFQGEI